MNGDCHGNDRIGDLMRDFSCANPDDMKSEVLRKSTTPYKRNEKEVEEMCQIVERLNRMAIEDDREARNEEIVMNFLKEDVPAETIARATKLPLEKVLEIQNKVLTEA